MMWNWFSVYWLGWFLLGFGIPEGYALATGRPEDTLSEQVWHLEGLTSATDATFWNPLTWSIPHFLIACGMVWLTVHFVDHAWHSM